ncbi:MFS transporter [Thermoanaerobacter wiegelii]|uniref:Major facilitator superfamily MFS_1 n=1 Tax=Thermoanaerobacter wiegelii Rt8.B1 TaxID=697303 RepID=G2MRI3_9THEO|nr:MFS transporter [Thermoanaerobacter wiegelii]AEM79345.1 major facilitator superfamily MFS_1 [Thermoanaerobacter wiegelii Rt8.B1]
MKNKRSLFYFFCSQIAIDIGNWIIRISVIAYLYQITQSGFLTTLVLIIDTAPRIILSIPFTRFCKKVGERKCCITTSIIQTIILSVIFFSLKQTYLILILLFLKSLVETLYVVSSNILFPALVNDNAKLLNYNFKLSAISAAIVAIGQMLGGIIYAFLGIKFSIFINTLAFGISAIFLNLISKGIHLSNHTNIQKNYNFNTTNKYESITNHKMMNLLILSNFIAVIGGGMFNSILPVFVQSNLNTSPQVFGVIMGCFGIGALIATLTFSFISKSINSYNIFLLSLVGLGFVFVLLGFIRTQIITGVLTLFFGSFSAMRGTSSKTLVQLYDSSYKNNSMLGLYQSTQNLGLLLGMMIGSYIIYINNIKIGVFSAGLLYLFAVTIAYFGFIRYIKKARSLYIKIKIFIKKRG